MNVWRYTYCFVGTLLILVDRCAKLWAEHNLNISQEVTSFFSFELSHNRGVSFGMFAHYSEFAFWVLTCAIAVLLALFVRIMVQRSQAGNVVIGEMLIVAGGFGNLCDRVWYGYVIDFISFYYQNWSFPNFNIADMCIVAGVSIVMMQLLVEEWNARN